MYGPPPVNKHFRSDGLNRSASMYAAYLRSLRLLATMGVRAPRPHKTLGLVQPFFEPGFRDVGSTVRPSLQSCSQTWGVLSPLFSGNSRGQPIIGAS
jgi:hypothetical protein